MYKKIHLIIYIRATMAEVGPPLGTTLGNIGVNTLKFCKEFNEFTKELPSYFLLKVIIFVEENKNFTFKVELPSIGFFISLLKKDRIEKNKEGIEITYSYILSEDLLKLSKFKFPLYPIEKSIKILKASLLSANVKLKNE